MSAILSYPYVFSAEIAEKVNYIQVEVEKRNREIFYNYDAENDVKQLDELVLTAFKLEDDNFVDYAIRACLKKRGSCAKSTK